MVTLVMVVIIVMTMMVDIDDKVMMILTIR